jgi:hypothetical protein
LKRFVADAAGQQGGTMRGYSWVAVAAQVAIAVGLGFIGAFVVFLFQALANIVSGATGGPQELKFNFGKTFALSVLFFLVVFGLVNGIIISIPFIAAGYVRVLHAMGIEVTQTLAAVAVIVIAFSAYRFKKAKQKVYGIVEVIFTAVSVVVALKTTPANNHLGLAVALIGAMYVGSRGFANYYEGKELSHP